MALMGMRITNAHVMAGLHDNSEAGTLLHRISRRERDDRRDRDNNDDDDDMQEKNCVSVNL